MTAPSILPLGQYLLDLSFENFLLDNPAPAPVVQVNVNVEARSLTPNDAGETANGDYESILILKITGLRMTADNQPDVNGKPAFITELRYAGRYRFADIPRQDCEPFLLIEAPRMLFPFARQIVADSAAHGGMASLLLAPVDFAQLYMQQRGKPAAA